MQDLYRHRCCFHYNRQLTRGEVVGMYRNLHKHFPPKLPIPPREDDADSRIEKIRGLSRYDPI